MRFTRDHEYVIVNGDVATIGVSDHAQQQLGDVVFVELPEIGAKFAKGAAAAVVESVKAASDVFAPIGGEVVEINEKVISETALVNEDAEGRGWLFRLKIANPREIDELLDGEAYEAYLKTID